VDRADDAADDRAVDLRETFRQQLIAGIGGWTGALITAIPTAVLIVVNVVASLRTAIVAAVGSAVLLAVYRLIRKQSVQQAITGLFGVIVAAFIAARTGQARGYFLWGIWTSFAYAVPFAVSMLVRRPLVGVGWEFVDPTPSSPDDPPWHRRRPLLRAYMWATLAGTLVFLARGSVQAALYHRNSTGWLAFARIAMGYPLFLLAAGISVLVVRRARRRLAASAGSAGSAASAGENRPA
jgi:Protein of unknown function (DUF3159)